jgi:hypothetical protein
MFPFHELECPLDKKICKKKYNFFKFLKSPASLTIDLNELLGHGFNKTYD